ncbi:dipeptide/oligopeptide/nickel ABC transporter ATP-binding protein [Agromyces sp. Root81]|uniref:ABC transporter ATP-binding protein n=1 Tax=Agromyces sp. Root81 TaxID=1736601 RepID=UPI0006FF562B|nr:ABC transporter ATP-binding protein [Agromyces sp. Root81]KRC63172.1 dipeptide/oligopeptide/nickel ABC transporter ATP-binding protein [Agromyces sp. Root81]
MTETAPTTGGVAISGLTLGFGRGEARKEILRGIDLVIPAGEITGLAGESGSGKTMTGLAVCGLLPAGADLGGSIRFDGTELIGLSQRRMNRYRGAKIAMIFQDPTASLHPMLTIEAQLIDHYRYHRGASKRAARTRALEMLGLVAVPDPRAALRKYPHQFSGGQLQRIAIASALMCEPSVLIADEPTTALDVTVQAGILRLLRRLCDELGIAIVLVTHDLGVMSALADTIAVMRMGEIVEHGDRHQVITAPQHPYTKSLIDALPETDTGSLLHDASGSETAA